MPMGLRPSIAGKEMYLEKDQDHAIPAAGRDNVVAPAASVRDGGQPDAGDGKEDGVLMEDMKVCGIDKVLAAYGRLIEKGELIRVDRLQLGYVGWYDSRDSETMRLLPMWMAEGYMTRPSTRKRGKDPSTLGIRDAEHSYIMVNAQTGELIDYRREDRKRSYDMPEILP